MHNSAKQNLWSEFFVSGVLLLLACNFALVFARDGQYFLPINNYIDLEVRLPYQYRILMVPVFRSLLHFFEIVDLQRLFTHVPPYLATSEALAYCTVNSVSFFVAAQIFRRIAFSVFQSKRLTAFAVSLFVVIIYMAFVINPNLNYILPYDLPSLAFMQAGTLLIIRKRWKTAIGLFAIATINRETTFLLIAFLVFSWWFDSRKERSGAFATAAVLSVIWVAVKIVLSLTITGNGSDAPLGGVAAMKIGYNLVEFGVNPPDELPDEVLGCVPEVPHLMSGISPRGFGHRCVGIGGQLVWDPHPSRAGLVTVYSIGLLVPMEER